MLGRRLRKLVTRETGAMRRLMAFGVAVFLIGIGSVSAALAASTHARSAAPTNRDQTYWPTDASGGAASGGVAAGEFRVISVKSHGKDQILVRLACARVSRCRLTDSVRMRVIKHGKSLRVTGLNAKGRHVATLIVERGRVTLKPGQTRTLIVKLGKVGSRLVLAGQRVHVRFTLAAGHDTIAYGRTNFVLSLNQ